MRSNNEELGVSVEKMAPIEVGNEAIMLAPRLKTTTENRRTKMAKITGALSMSFNS